MKTKIYPEIGFLRLRDIIGDRNNPGIIPVSRSPRAEGIAEGRYPKPAKLSERTSAWRVEDIKKLVDKLKLKYEVYFGFLVDILDRYTRPSLIHTIISSNRSVENGVLTVRFQFAAPF